MSGSEITVRAIYDSIGLGYSEISELFEYVKLLLEDSVAHPCAKGFYLQKSYDCGMEFWAHCDHTKTIRGYTPFYRGKSEYVLGLKEEFIRPGDTDFEGSILGWAEPDPDGDHGLCPVVFDVLGRKLHSPLQFPFESAVKMCAFAVSVDIFDSPEAYERTQTHEIKFDCEAFFPGDLLLDKPRDPHEPPSSCAVINGRILEFRKITNPVTSQDFYWILAKTAGGIMDMVTKCGTYTSDPRVGGVITGGFWLCGQIMDPQIRKRSGLQRILRKTTSLFSTDG